MASGNYRLYVASTVAFGLAGVAGLAGLVYYGVRGEWFPLALCAVIAFVAFDNFFCGSRLNRAGGRRACTHWVVPPFLRFRK